MFNSEKFDQLSIDEKHQYFMDAYSKLRRSGVIKTWKDFAALTESSTNTISAAKNKNPKYLTSSLLVKIEDLTSQYHDQTVQISHISNSNVATGQGQININGQQHPDDQQDEDEMVPIIPTNIYKEADLDVYKYVTDEDNDIQMSPAIQQFPKTDMFYTVNTKAMFPDIHQGDILALKKVSKNKTLVNGEVYAIDTSSNGILVRYAYDRGDKVELRPSEEAERFETIYVEKEDIFNYFRVVGLVRTNI